MIRVATEADWATIPEIHRAAFGEEGDAVARLTGELRASRWYEPELSFVADEGDAIVGHVMNTWNWLEGGSPKLLQLSPLGVLPEHQRRGHGSALVRASLDAVRARGEPLLLVEAQARADRGDADGMRYERLSRAPLLPLVRGGGEPEGARDELDVDVRSLGGKLGEQPFEQLLVPLTCFQRRHPSQCTPAVWELIPVGGTVVRGAK